MSDDLSLNHLLELGFEEGLNDEEALDFSDIPDGDWRFGGYELLEEIGCGGMGRIYKARQPHSKRLVALKRLRVFSADEADALQAAQRLKREAEAVASLDHPNILPIYEVGVGNDGLPFYSMKLALGGSLAQLKSRVEQRQAVTWMAKVARALQHAHGSGILHRDLKPANILLDAENEPLVADFGLAKWLDRPSDMTQALTVFGTPGYLAPEQARGDKVGWQTDVYSIGAILFELLSGRPPFVGEDARNVVKEASEEPAPKLGKLVAGIPLDLETICARCLERDMAARYKSAGDLADDLQRWLDGRPILARRITLVETGWRWARRNPLLSGSSLFVAILTLGLLFQWNHGVQMRLSLQEQERDRRSLVILPFLNVDTAQSNPAFTTQLHHKLAELIAPMGFARVDVSPQKFPEWTGAGTKREIEAATRSTGAKYALTGVYHTDRSIPESPARMTLFLLKDDGVTVLRRWNRDINNRDAVINENLAQEIFHLIDTGKSPAHNPMADASEAKPLAANYLKVGNDLMQRRNLADADRALVCFESAIREAPDSILARSYLALATMGRQSMAPDAAIWARGLQAAEEAVALQPDNPAANRAYGVLLGMQGDYHGELNHYLKAISCGYESERALGQIGFAYLMIGQPDMALRWYAKAKEAAQRPAEYDSYIGDCLALLGRYDEAAEAYHSADEFHPELTDGWAGMCRLLLRQKKFTEAQALYETKKNSFLNSPESAWLGALIAFFGRHFEEARPLIEPLSEEPRFGNGQFGAMDWGVALARLDSTPPDERKKLLDECIHGEQEQIARLPNDAEAHYRLGAAYAVAQRKKEALASLQTAIANGWLDLACLEIDPRWDAVHDEPQFQAILTRRKPLKTLELTSPLTVNNANQASPKN